MARSGDFVAPILAAIFGSGETVEGEVAAGLVVPFQNPHFEIERRKTFLREVGEGVDVAEGFGDFLVVDVDKVAVEPEIGEFFAESGLGLGDFVGMVDWDVVDAAGVDVDGFTELGVDDGGTFEVPTWVAWAAEKIPAHGVVFAVFDEFPNCKVRGVFLFGAEINAGAGFETFKVEVGEVGIGREFRGVEIDAVGGFVGETFFDEGFDESFVSFDIVRGAGKDIWFEEMESVKIFEKGGNIELGDFPDGFSFFLCAFFEFVFAFVAVRNEMANVGEVQDSFCFETVESQDTEKKIPINIGSEVADVGEAVDCGSASVDFYLVFAEGAESFEGFFCGVIEF